MNERQETFAERYERMMQDLGEDAQREAEAIVADLGRLRTRADQVVPLLRRLERVIDKELLSLTKELLSLTTPAKEQSDVGGQDEGGDARPKAMHHPPRPFLVRDKIADEIVTMLEGEDKYLRASEITRRLGRDKRDKTVRNALLMLEGGGVLARGDGGWHLRGSTTSTPEVPAAAPEQHPESKRAPQGQMTGLILDYLRANPSSTSSDLRKYLEGKVPRVASVSGTLDRLIREGKIERTGTRKVSGRVSAGRGYVTEYSLVGATKVPQQAPEAEAYTQAELNVVRAAYQARSGKHLQVVELASMVGLPVATIEAVTQALYRQGALMRRGEGKGATYCHTKPTEPGEAARRDAERRPEVLSHDRLMPTGGGAVAGTGSQGGAHGDLGTLIRELRRNPSVDVTGGGDSHYKVYKRNGTARRLLTTLAASPRDPTTTALRAREALRKEGIQV